MTHRSHMFLNRRSFLARTGGIALGASGVAMARSHTFQQTPAASPVAEADLTGVTHRQVETNGISMHIAEAGEGPLVVMVHGFPEMWYSWRHQLPALAAAGYHAVALDMRGVGGSEATDDVRDYSLRTQIADILGLIDALSEERAVLVGHDTGAGATWACTELHPDRIAAHATLGIAYGPRQPAPPIEGIREFAGDRFNFALHAQEPGVAEAEFEADVYRFFRIFMYALSGDAPADVVPYFFTEKPADEGVLEGLPDPESLPDWLTEEDLDVYTDAYKRTGFTGVLNPYRNFDWNWEDLPEVGTLGVRQPALFIGGRRDSAVMFTQGEMDPFVAAVPNLKRIVLLPGCGHWTQQECPDDVNAELIGFLQRDSGL